MEETIPQLPYSQEHSRLHPINLLTSLINGLVAVEAWRQRPDGVDTFLGRVHERVINMRLQEDARVAEQRQIDNLKIAAWLDPERFAPSLYKKLESHHTARAEALGSYLLALETDQPRFGGVKRWLAEKRRAHHRSKAAEAAGRLLT